MIYGHETGDAGAMGNIFLALNCLGTSLYVIFAKVALQRFPALTVTAWAMMAASLMMAMLALSLNSCEVVQFVCPPGGACDQMGNGTFKLGELKVVVTDGPVAVMFFDVFTL